ncbi:hypothetical protein WMY93_000749 [Mugilogobius chulae]|uniref:Doublecortin domain-containing protein n=1 Tax=Mugilogobius chulae TaxID=88201 RepID=A0AAW0Q063_9GOBI
MVINARTFKTFDALLDALSKKVPLAFGVRTISTPRGIHFVKGLDDLYDGGAYVCSDQKRVKPINLKELNRRQVPWNTTRAVSARRRRQGAVLETMRKMTERVAVRTPKRLEVIKNRDPSVRRTIILQKRTAPTFDALLDYLSQILLFPVLKLYSTDGRRVDGLAALILCSGVIVAAGNEPFRLGNYRFQKSSQMAQAVFMESSEASVPQPQAYNNKSSLNGKSSRKFSPSSERYIVNQINKSRYGNYSPEVPNELVNPETAVETCANAPVENHCHTGIIPQDEDIEKSFRVNQDGSMTVEMKVRLKIKEEEMLHWTTTVSRSSLSKQSAYPMISETANSSPDCNNASEKKRNVSEEETKQANLPAERKSSVVFIEEKLCDTPEVIERKSVYRRPPTPGPVKKKGVKIIPRTEVQELDQYTYKKTTSDKNTTEEYHVVRHSSSRSNRPVPKPRKNTTKNGVAEVLQVEHNGYGVKETVLHIYERQGCRDAYFVNEQYSVDSVPMDESSSELKLANDRRQSINNDCDIDSSWQPPVVDPAQHQNEEILSLSSEPLSTSCKITNNLSSVTDNLTQTVPLQDVVKANKGDRKRMAKHGEKQKSLASSLDKKPEKLSNKASVGKRSSMDSAKTGQKPPIKEKATESNLKSPTMAAPYNGHNVNVPDTKTTTNKMKKSISDILKPKKSVPANQRALSPKKSVNKNARSSKKSVEIGESSAPIPSVNPSPSEIHQYVENWLEKVSPEVVPYVDEDPKSQSKVEFQLGDDSEGEEKNQSQFYMENNCASSEDIKKSDSSLSVPVVKKGQCKVSQDGRLYKSEVAINSVGDIISSPKNKLKPVIRQICSSVECISRAAQSNTMPHIAKSTSLPDFPSQVASVFGSSCKTFLSFLSVMTLRDSLTGFAPSHGSSPKLSSEAMLMMESLQKISTIENEKKLRASLSDLQNKASSQLKEQWQDYQMKRGKSASALESEIDAVCQNMNEFGDEQLGISEIIDELSIPADLRAEIFTAIQQAFSSCPVSEISMTEIDQNQSALREEQLVIGGDVIEKDRKCSGSLDEAVLLKGQSSEEVNKVVEEEISSAKQVDLLGNVLKNRRSTDEDSEHEKEEDKGTVDSEVVDEQTNVISQTDLEEEDEDTFQDTDSNVVHSGKNVSEKAGGEQNEEHENYSQDEASQNVLEEALYLERENSSCDEVKSDSLQNPSIKSTSKYSSEGKCVEDKCNGSYSVSELETENFNLNNPFEISQDLLDFVNSAIQSSSLIFTYDSQGNVKVAPNVQPAQTTGRDSTLDFKCLPSPNTSEITDYRPDSLESVGYKTQESLDIVTESEDLDTPFAVCKHSPHKTQDISDEQAVLERTDSKLSSATCKSKTSLSTNDSGTKNLKGGLTEQCVSSVPGKHSPDGVLIDHGRWLLKENHLIRKSPPESTDMYGNLDNTSMDTSVGEDSPTHYQSQANPLTALSSSELEEMTKPATPK